MKYYTPELAQQAKEILSNSWDWHPNAKLPEGLGLCYYEDGVWVVDYNNECEFRKFIKLERITDETWG